MTYRITLTVAGQDAAVKVIRAVVGLLRDLHAPAHLRIERAPDDSRNGHQ